MIQRRSFIKGLAALIAAPFAGRVKASPTFVTVEAVSFKDGRITTGGGPLVFHMTYSSGASSQSTVSKIIGIDREGNEHDMTNGHTVRGLRGIVTTRAVGSKAGEIAWME